jgi:hypothetical protein
MTIAPGIWTETVRARNNGIPAGLANDIGGALCAINPHHGSSFGFSSSGRVSIEFVSTRSDAL